jgi:site-specific DNA-adenine methylase
MFGGGGRRQQQEGPQSAPFQINNNTKLSQIKPKLINIYNIIQTSYVIQALKDHEHHTRKCVSRVADNKGIWLPCLLSYLLTEDEESLIDHVLSWTE